MTPITPKFIKQNFGRIWPKHVETLTRFLIHCRKHFNGDLDLFLVLAVVGDRSFASGNASVDLTYQAFRDESRVRTKHQPINSLSIADFSGIPRETVRRKVQELINRGWISRDDEGYLIVTPKVAEDLTPLTEISFDYLTRMAETFAAACDEAEPHIADSEANAKQPRSKRSPEDGSQFGK